MKTILKYGLCAVLVTLPLGAEEVSLEVLLKGALERDGELAILEAQRRMQRLQNDLEDYKNGLIFGIGTGEEGFNLTEVGESTGETPLEPTLVGAPTLTLTLPEKTGTRINLSLPSQLSLENPGTPGFSASLGLTQNLNELFQWKSQDLKKKVARDSQRHSLENSIRARRLEVENTLLSLIRSLGEIQRGIISNRTQLYRQTTDLESKLRGETILRKGSSHLLALMEIRQTQDLIDEAELDLRDKKRQIAELTGVMPDDFPPNPKVLTPILPQMGDSQATASSRWKQKILEAELSDLKASKPPQWDVSAEGTQGITTPDERSFSLDLSGKFEDFELSFTGNYSLTQGFSLGAVFNFSPPDRGKNQLQERILAEELAIAEENLKKTLREALEIRNELERELKKLKNREANLRANRAFLEEYLQEMEGKFTEGFIPEIEFLKAQDQMKMLRMDENLLNLDRHLLNNRILSQLTEDP